MSYPDLAIHHQQEAADLYQFARWVSGKASRAKERGGDFIIRRNQFTLEADRAAKASATARALMGIE